MRATSAFVRLYIRGLAWDAEDASATFADTLKAAARAKVNETGKGKYLSLARANGTEARYELPPAAAGLSAVDITEVAGRVLDACDIIKAATPDINDEDLLTALLAAFPEIKEVRTDHSTFPRL